MESRLRYYANPVAAKFVKYINSAVKVVTDSSLDPTLQELVKIRVSQINGCAVCTDMHTKDAAHAGETAVRLALVAAWRDAKVFSDAERAAFALAEEGTRVADAGQGVSDETWKRAERHFDEDQLAALVSLIAVMNAYNRMNAIPQIQGGSYEPGKGH
jgi:AhpD family alkylhydroperoxidase